MNDPRVDTRDVSSIKSMLNKVFSNLAFFHEINSRLLWQIHSMLHLYSITNLKRLEEAQSSLTSLTRADVA